MSGQNLRKIDGNPPIGRKKKNNASCFNAIFLASMYLLTEKLQLKYNFRTVTLTSEQ